MPPSPLLRALVFAVTAAVTGCAGTFCFAAKTPDVPVPKPNPPPAAPAALASLAKLDFLTREATEPVGMATVPGEKAGRLFVVEKRGLVRILRGKTFAPTPFFDMVGKVAIDKREGGEQGLLGLAFHPNYLKNGRFFINFTDPKGDTRVVEHRVDRKSPDRADPTPVREWLFVDQPYSNHNAGHLAFGPDGRLYVLLGDGGSGGDPQGNGQNPKTMLGKMLRLDVDAAPTGPEVIGRGMRNPWRYSFDRKSGDLYVADVGQNIFEWIHVLPAGRLAGHNLGWSVAEGLHCFQGKPCDLQSFTRPLIEYPHSEGCSITGGYVYRGKALPALDGTYFFADYCTAIVRGFRVKEGRAIDHFDWKAALDPDHQLARISAFGEDQDGELYLLSHDGPIYKLVRR